MLNWQKKFGGNDEETVYGFEQVRQTTDNGYIIVGNTRSWGEGNYDILVIKLDQYYDVDWAKTFGGDNIEHVSSIQQTYDGKYIIVGETNSFGAGVEI